LAATLSVRADVLVYKVVQTNTWTGGGTRFTQVVNGRMVFDPETLAVGIFTALPNLRFQIDCPDTTIAHVRGPNSVDQSAWFLGGTAYNDANEVIGTVQFYLRGTDTQFFGDLVSPGVRAPKLLRGTYRAAYRAAGDSGFVGEGNLVATYLSDPTRNANLAGKTPMEFLETMRQNYVGKGWVEVAADAPCF
jgi:hypothetical protein